MNASKTKSPSRKTPASAAAAEQPKRRGRPPGSGKASAAAEAVAATKTAGVWQMIPVASITPSPSNPRKHFHEESLADLAVSIGSKGVLQPILVRPYRPYYVLACAELPIAILGEALIDFGWVVADRREQLDRRILAKTIDNRDLAEVQAAGQNHLIATDVNGVHFELVAGERRWRAAKIAGLEHMPCIVRELSDVDVLEVQVIENEQRDDVSPLEKAEGYAALVEQHGVSVDDLAVRVGKSTSTIRELLKLRRLPEQARAALEAGTLPASTAGLIARVPSLFHRERVALCVVNGIDWLSPEAFANPQVDIKKLHQGAKRDEPLSFRTTKELIETNCMVELKGAAFNRHRSGLVEGVVSCEMCPKRVGNLQIEEPEHYAGVRADICTDPGCYRSKCEAHAAEKIGQARDAGHDVLTEAAAAELFVSYMPERLCDNAPYIDLAGSCCLLKKDKPWKKLVGKQLADRVVVAVDPAGGVHELVPKKDALAILKSDHGYTGSTAADNGWQSDYKKQQASDRRKAKLGAAAADSALCLIASDMEAAATKDVGGQALKLFRAVVAGLAEEQWNDACRLVSKRRGLKPAGKGDNHVDALKSYILDLDWNGLLGVTAELVAARKVLWWRGGHAGGVTEKSPVLDAFGISYKDMLKRAKELGGAAGDD